MDVKEYISSGILELYAAGALNAAESAEVEAMAAKHAEVKAELDAIQNALNNYTSLHRKNPPPELRQSVLDKITDLEGDSGNVTAISKPVSVHPEEYYRRSAMPKYLMAAVWIFLVLNVAGNIYFFTKLKDTREQMTAVVNENTKMKSDYERIRLDMEKKSTDMKMVMNRTNKIVDMKGLDIAPQAFATVYWNPLNKKVMLNIENLPVPPADKQYQLWALKDGKPIDAGVFDMAPIAGGDMHMMPVTIEDADAFAVTLEKKGGSPTPTLTQLYVMGKI